MLESKPSCWFAYKGLSVDSTGNLNPCGHSTYKFGKFTDYNSLNVDRTNAIKDFDQHVPEGCISCTNREVRNEQSRRLYHYDWFCQQVNFNIEFLDIDIGNLCNLKCRMCNPGQSSSWIIDRHLKDKVNFTLDDFDNSKILDNINDDMIKFVYHHHNKEKFIESINSVTLPNTWAAVADSYAEVIKNVAARPKVNRYRN